MALITRTRCIQADYEFSSAYAVAAALIFATSALSAKEPASAVCQELGRLLSSPKEFQQRSPSYILDERNAVTIPNLTIAPDRQWNSSLCFKSDGPAVIPNVDLDGDGLLDSLHFDCPGSASIRKPDACKAEVHFGGGYRLQLPDYFPLLAYGGKYYAVDAEIGIARTKGSGTAYRITRTGLQPVCTKL